jgi:hypothetical protein
MGMGMEFSGAPTLPESIEDIILDHDQRGVSALRSHLPPDFCTQAAQFILDRPGDVLIATGFYILSAGKHETDGPPGGIAIGNALQSLGRRVSYVSDQHTTPMLRDWLGDSAEVIDFPIADVSTSRQMAGELLEQFRPGLLITIERCGRTSSNAYLNMRSVDITQYTARLDHLFESGIPSVGIGDGGNEIGMGNLVDIIPTVDKLPRDPAVTRVDRLVIASVSNWGGYGLVAALSRLVGRNLLPAAEEDRRLIRRMVDTGAVDGTSGENKYYVDNFTLEENAALLEQLHRVVREIIPSP